MVERTDGLPGYYLPDDERCAFGLGWEHRRRNLGYTNPFVGHEWKEEAYQDGYEQFVPPKGGEGRESALTGKTE